MSLEENKVSQKESFHFGHLFAVLFVALVLVGITWMKNPGLFRAQRFKTTKSEGQIAMPRYYAYVPPAEDTQPLVAGASTQTQGPSIINEDGSIAPAMDIGEVLGVTTEDLSFDLNQVSVKTVADSQESVVVYIQQSQDIEMPFSNSAEFELALTSDNQELINRQAQKIIEIRDTLGKLLVPQSFVELHRLKIVQYNAAIEILKNFINADKNPQGVTRAMGVFLQTQQLMEGQILILQQRFDLNV